MIKRNDFRDILDLLYAGMFLDRVADQDSMISWRSKPVMLI